MPKPYRLFFTTPLLCSVVLLATGCGRAKPANQSASSQPAAAKSQPVTVATAPVTINEVPVTIHATGTFAAAESSDVSPQVSGQVIETPVNVGDVVHAGDVIARLDDRDTRARLVQANAALQQAQATEANAKAQENRSAGLVKTGDISQSDFQTLVTQVATADAQVGQAKAQVTLAEQALNETVIHAPFAGHVSARPTAAGEYVTTSSKIATIVKLQPIKLELQIPETDAAKITTGMAVSAQVVSYPQKKFSGRITAKNPALNTDSRALIVVAQFPNTDSALNPGMFATAEVRLSQTEQALYVPSKAVFTPAGSPSAEVYVVQDGKARIRVVQTGETKGDLTRVVSGLQPGDAIVMSNQDKLFDGQAVDVQ